MAYYKQHLYFCTNAREAGKTCCQTGGDAAEVCSYAKERIRELGLAGKGGVRVSSSGCMGRCSEGPTVVIYPEAVWYRYQTKSDIDNIIEQHVQQGIIVESLRMAE